MGLVTWSGEVLMSTRRTFSQIGGLAIALLAVSAGVVAAQSSYDRRSQQQLTDQLRLQRELSDQQRANDIRQQQQQLDSRSQQLRLEDRIYRQRLQDQLDRQQK
jgi:hypothetical protein